VAEKLGDWAGAFTLLMIVLLFVTALLYELASISGLPLVSIDGWTIPHTDRWAVFDVGYLAGLALLAAVTLCHAMLISPTRSPLTAIWLSIAFGTLGVLLAMVEILLDQIGADTDWKLAVTFSSFVLNVLPFLMVLAAGIVMLRMRDRSIRFRVIGVGICVASAAVVVVLAAWIPRLVRATELGTH